MPPAAKSVQCPRRSRSGFERAALAVLLLTGLALLLTALTGTWVLLLLVPPCGAALLWTVRFYRIGVVGPLFYYDLIRLARRGRSTLLRTTYGLVLFAFLALAYTSQYPGHDVLADPFAPGPRVALRDQARFAHSFVVSLTAVQGAAVLILTPAYLAPAIAEEKERRTLQLLFATPLHDHEIVLGKLLARLAHLGGILLTGIPILAGLQLWGGFDPVLLVAAVVSGGMSLWSVGSMSILFSVTAGNVLRAVVQSYLFVAFLSLVCLPVSHVSPVTFLMGLEDQLSSLSPAAVAPGMGRLVPVGPGRPSWEVAMERMSLFALLHGILGLVCAMAAITQLRTMGLPRDEPARPLPPAPPVPEEQIPRSLRFDPDRIEQERLYRPVPITEEPLLWKEAYHGRDAAMVLPPRALIALVWPVVVLLLVSVWLLVLGCELTGLATPRQILTDGLNPVCRGLTLALMAVACVGVALRTTVSMVQERDQQTLEGLLTLPVSRGAILEAKWLGALLRFRELLCTLGLLWLVGVLTGALHPVAVLWLLATCGTHLMLVAGAGLWLSLVCRNTLWAHSSMALLLLLFFGGSWIYQLNTRDPRTLGAVPAAWGDALVEVGLSPLRAWWSVGFSWHQFQEAAATQDRPFWTVLTAIGAAVGVCYLATWLFWLIVRQRFRREAERCG